MYLAKTRTSMMSVYKQLLRELKKPEPLSTQKNVFFFSQLRFLGHIIDQEGIRADPSLYIRSHFQSELELLTKCIRVHWLPDNVTTGVRSGILPATVKDVRNEVSSKAACN